jgi:F-type H+-transporting ATPase subunit delta
VYGTAIGNRYARALLDVALAQGTEQAVMRELEELEAWLGRTPAVRRYFHYVTVEKAQKKRLLLELLPHLGLSRHAANLLRFMADNGRLDRLGEVVAGYRHLLREHEGILGVEVATAAALDGAERELIRRAISSRTGKRVVFEEQVDPQLIGGLRYRIGSMLYDGSVRSQLALMKASLVKE